LARARLIAGGRDGILLLAARVAMSSQRALVGVVVPIYLARRGFSAAELGALFALVALAAAGMSALIGFAADRFARKPFVVGMPLLSAAAGVVFALTGATPALFAAAAVGSFGRGSGAGAAQVGPYQPAEQALMAGLVEDRHRNYLFGLVASASAAGALLGTLLTITPLSSPTTHRLLSAATYRPAFLAGAALAALAAGLALPVREPGQQRARELAPDASGRRRGGPPPLSPASRRLVRRLWATNGVNGLAVGLFGPFVTYWLYRRFGAGPSTVGALYTIANVITIATNQLAAPLARRRGAVRTVVAARTAQALLLPALAVMPSLAAAGAIYTVRLVVQRIGVSLRTSFVMSSAPPSERARVGAFSQLPVQAISAVSPTLSGYLFDEVSLAAPFELAGGLQLLNAWLFYRFFAAAERQPSTDPSRARAAEPATRAAATLERRPPRGV
jgi:MFS family permease